MSLSFSTNNLRLIAYEGAGNRTPVLDMSHIEGISSFPPETVRDALEKNVIFRKWLVEQGKSLHADSIMMYYRSHQKNYDYVTFIGEPNAPLTNQFSTMCGNGIRCLALHILLRERNIVIRNAYLQKGIRIWAGGVKNIRIETLDEILHIATVRVEMGPFQFSKRALSQYTNGKLHGIRSLESIVIPNEFIHGLRVGIGFNGIEDGEPHLVILTRWEEYLTLLQHMGVQDPPTSQFEIISSLRNAVCVIGRDLTFLYNYFPQGININLALVLYDEVFMSTHERNLSSGREECLEYARRNQFCTCNTMACGTGGSAVANIAVSQGFVQTSLVVTHHPGGDIDYSVSGEGTVMIGPAKEIVTSSLELKGGNNYATV